MLALTLSFLYGSIEGQYLTTQVAKQARGILFLEA
jgi:hypothetical protein